MTTLIEKLAQFGLQSQFEKLPPEVVVESKRLMLDSIGCAIGALKIEKGKLALAAARGMGGSPEVKVIGTGERLSASAAAFANGELINALDYDSIITPPGHVTPYILPAILGMAETRRSSGKRLIVANAVAHEVSARLGLAMGYYRDAAPGAKINFPAVSGFSSTIFGGTLGTALLRGLHFAGIANAMGLAGHITPVQTLAKWGRTLPGSDDKYLLSGWMGQAELLAVLLAEHGYRGDVQVLEGDYGFWRFVGSSKWNPEPLTERLGEAWRFPPMTIYKPWPHCRGSNTALDCLQHLIETHDLKPDEIEAMTVYWDSHTAPLPLWSTKEIATFSDAQMSAGYAASMVAHRVRPGPEWYSNDALANPTFLAFIERINLEPHPEFEEALHEDPQSRIGKVELRARGKTFAEERRFRKGSPATPGTRMSNSELAEKFLHNAEGILSSSVAQRVVATILELERAEDVSEVTAIW
ncbi:MAG: MmgE/PrpD family protein [Mesorhizobium sp.]|nr:MAG: MmgE/PrpD family protein [Mesorhizobium sp.]